MFALTWAVPMAQKTPGVPQALEHVVRWFFDSSDTSVLKGHLLSEPKSMPARNASGPRKATGSKKAKGSKKATANSRWHTRTKTATNTATGQTAWITPRGPWNSTLVVPETDEESKSAFSDTKVVTMCVQGFLRRPRVVNGSDEKICNDSEKAAPEEEYVFVTVFQSLFKAFAATIPGGKVETGEHGYSGHAYRACAEFVEEIGVGSGDEAILVTANPLGTCTAEDTGPAGILKARAAPSDCIVRLHGLPASLPWTSPCW
eukprot:INCI4912.1.p1 GENE.INCI4912.1~~INCI4912.1.p1  ORF type:complete len:260 (-),score=32.47 INCI4912.1:156-935(-)